MTGLEQLFEQITAEQDGLRERSQVRAQVRIGLQNLELPERRASRSGAWKSAGIALGLAAAASAALLVWPERQADVVPLTARVGDDKAPAEVGAWVSAPLTEAIPLHFSDGTRIDVTAGSRARLVALEPTGAHLAIESGQAQVQVVSKPQAKWLLSMGPFTVRVTGTRFTVGWSPEQDTFELDLTEGSVELSGCVFGQSQRVTAGQFVRASCKRGRVSIVRRDGLPLEPAASGAAPTGNATAEPAADERATSSQRSEAPLRPPGSSPSPTKGRPASATSWQSLAHLGKYRDAFAAAEASGFESECNKASAGELLLLGDAARYVGEARKSEYALKLLRQRFPGTKGAAQAAFALGRLSFDTLGSYAQAAQWFRTYLREQPGGSLSREARGRLMEALHRSGDTKAAEGVANQYLSDYPQGPYAELARRIVGKSTH